VRAGAI